MNDDCRDLLRQLIETPSFSGDEDRTASLIHDFLIERGIEARRFANNVWARNRRYSPDKRTLLLNSHHDTVRPAPTYTRNPFEATLDGGKLYGLGSNDAGGAVVALLATFCKLYDAELPFNLIVAITAEEEAIGRNGIAALLPQLGAIDAAIVGEPTRMQAAVAERGLLVLDCLSKGVAGHAARNEGDNAIHKALDDLRWFRDYRFAKISPLMGEVKMSVTVVSAGTQHNAVPAECRFVVDIRPTDRYSNGEIVETVRRHVACEVVPRSLHLRASSIPETHPLTQTVQRLGIPCFVSPTTSDIARLNVPAIKIGPGDSARSHTADEYICINEIDEGINKYELIIRNCELQ